jgi:methylenetetrahydrofolate dehydrogenase (NADP+)/methenyltetrahydrofolate cyclohydrolase
VTRIFTGHALAGRIHDRIRGEIVRLGRAPRCTVLIDEASAPMVAYASRQREAAATLGIELAFASYERSPELVRDQLKRLGEDPRLDAVMTLYPLPSGIAPVEAALLTGADKDVDGLHPENAGLLALGAPGLTPATAHACRLAIGELAGSLRGAEITIVGASRIVGRPLATMLLDAEATVTVCHVATRDLADHTRRADVVVSAAGVAGLIGAAHIRDGAIVVDVSIIRTEAGLVGDVDLAAVEGKASVVTHVPDGIGPITTACLFENVVAAAAQAGR